MIYSNIYYLPINGCIEGHTTVPPNTKAVQYEAVLPQIIEVSENPDIRGLFVSINTIGGDVEAGLAIAELIVGINKPTVSLILGGCHSIGVAIAVSANNTFIAPSATMTLHPVRMNGTVVGSPQTYGYFDKMQERVDDFVIKHSKISRARLKELILSTDNIAVEMGTVLVGQEAVREGLIDRVGNLNDAKYIIS